MLILCAHLRKQNQFREGGGSYINVDLELHGYISLNPSHHYVTQCQSTSLNWVLHIGAGFGEVLNVWDVHILPYMCATNQGALFIKVCLL